MAQAHEPLAWPGLHTTRRGQISPVPATEYTFGLGGFIHLTYYIIFSKEVWKLNFRQYGKMEMAQQGRNSDVEKVRSEKIRDGEDQRWRKSEERRCRCAKR